MRRLAFIQVTATLALAVLLGSCGQPGSPQPPSLELPRPIEDLSASRKGDRVTLRWTPPNRFTDNRIIRRVGPTQICRVPGNSPATQCSVVGKLPAPPAIPKGKPPQRVPVQYEDLLPPSVLQSAPTGSVMYGVELLNVHGRSIGVSTQVQISTAPALPPPSRLSPTVGDSGVTLTWNPIAAPAISGIAFAYQISRRGETGDFATVGSVTLEQSSYVDQTIEWEKKFEYRIAVVTQSANDKQVLVEGTDSETVSVFTHDIFPPAPPRELQAVFSGPGQQPFIDVSWAPNLEPDLAGYNLYRHEEGAAAVKLNDQLITSPSFRDEKVEAGKTYFYSVSAADVRGNESAKSAETSESVPR
jgi:hypothetical protein